MTVGRWDGGMVIQTGRSPGGGEGWLGQRPATARGVEGGPLMLIRADAGPQLGTGHAMRCMALAQAWQECGGRACVAMGETTQAVVDRLQANGIGVAHVDAAPGSREDAVQTADLAWRTEAAWVAVDGYQFCAEFQRVLKAAGLGVLFLDDYGHAEHYCADLVLNQNLYAAEGLYPSREGYTRLLLGTRCALLRREFWPWSGWQRRVPEAARKVLVTLGGADPGNTTLKVLEALQQVPLPDLEVQVAVGGSNPHLETLKHWLGCSSGGSVRDRPQRAGPELRDGSVRDRPERVGSGPQRAGPRASLLVDAPNMPELMAWADVAVSAAGTTCWELAFMQLPALVVVLADNQRPNAEALAGAGAAVNLGWHAEISPAELAEHLTQLLESQAQRASMAQHARELVDGEGGHRVADLLHQPAIRVRPAAAEDREALYRWANDPLTRRMSFRLAQIAWEEHLAWFERVTGDPHAGLVIAEAWAEGSWKPVGQVRFDAPPQWLGQRPAAAEGGTAKAEACTVSIGLAPECRGRGLAGPALRAAIGVRRAQFPDGELVACVKPENAPSQRAFALVGFRLAGPTEVMGQACLRYEYP